MITLLLGLIYLAFISLGLPDALLGSAWPVMHQEFNVEISYAGIVAMIITIGTVISSLNTVKVVKRFGTGRVTTFSVLTTAIALIGFSTSSSFWMICLWAVPYGLGAGAVDAALNNFVALHFKSKHMNWLHSFWGVGASLGPFIMGFSLSRELGWNMGYLFIFIIQVALTMVLFVSLPLWKKVSEEHGDVTTESYKLLDLIKLKGSKPALLTFFAYCGLEHGAGLWGATFAVIALDFDPKFAAMMVSIYYLGITIGRMVSGFISMKLNNQSMVRLGQVIILVGSFILMFGKSEVLVASGFILIGLGCAPIFPSLLHQTPVNFGKEKSQAMIGVQMASAYVGSSLIPPLFGYLLQSMSIYLFPYIIFVLAITMIISAEQLNRRRNEKLY